MYKSITQKTIYSWFTGVCTMTKLLGVLVTIEVLLD